MIFFLCRGQRSNNIHFNDKPLSCRWSPFTELRRPRGRLFVTSQGAPTPHRYRRRRLAEGRPEKLRCSRRPDKMEESEDADGTLDDSSDESCSNPKPAPPKPPPGRTRCGRLSPPSPLLPTVGLCFCRSGQTLRLGDRTRITSCWGRGQPASALLGFIIVTLFWDRLPLVVLKWHEHVFSYTYVYTLASPPSS